MRPARATSCKGLLSIFIESTSVKRKPDMQEARKFLDVQIAEYEDKTARLGHAPFRHSGSQNAEVIGSITHQARLTAALATLRDAELARQVASERPRTDQSAH